MKCVHGIWFAWVELAGDEAMVRGERPECHPKKFGHYYISNGGLMKDSRHQEWSVLYFRKIILYIYSIVYMFLYIIIYI